MCKKLPRGHYKIHLKIKKDVKFTYKFKATLIKCHFFVKTLKVNSKIYLKKQIKTAKRNSQRYKAIEVRQCGIDTCLHKPINEKEQSRNRPTHIDECEFCRVRCRLAGSNGLFRDAKTIGYPYLKNCTSTSLSAQKSISIGLKYKRQVKPLEENT